MVIMESSSMTIHEEDVIKLILEFLSTRHYHVTMRTLEKESGVINCDYSDEVLFLRDLVMDGDFEEIIQFGNSFMGSPTFNQKRFNFLVLKQKYIELIYTKSHIIGKQTYNIVEDVMKTLSELKCYCSTKDEYSDFCWLLTVPNLNSLDQFKNWSLDLSRLRCFEELLDCLSSFMPLVKKKISSRHISTNDRLLHLLVKGLFYESCIEYCQAIGSGDSEGLCNNDLFKRDLLKSKFDDYSSNLLSWILCLPHEAFVTPFQQMDVDIRFTRLVKKANITNSLDVTSVLKTKTSSIQLSQSLPDQASVKKKNYESLNKNYEILNKNESMNNCQEPLNQTFTKTHQNNDMLNKKNEILNMKNSSLHSNGIVSGVSDIINDQNHSSVPKQASQRKSSIPDSSNKINNNSMNIGSDNHAERKEKKTGDNQVKVDKNIPLSRSQKSGMPSTEDVAGEEDGAGELKLDNVQQSGGVIGSGPTTPSHPNLSFFIPMEPVAQHQQMGEESKTQPQPLSSSTPKSNTYTKDMKPENPVTVMSKTDTYNKHSKGDSAQASYRETKPDIAVTYTKETLPDFNSRETRSDVCTSILPEDKSGVNKSPLTPSITTSPGISRKKKSEGGPPSNRSSVVRTSTSAKEAKKSPGDDSKSTKKGSGDGQKDLKKSSVGEMQRKKSDSMKDSKKADTSPKKIHSGDDDSHPGSNSTSKAKRNDRSSFPPISPLKKKAPENEEKPGVDGPAGDANVRPDGKDDIAGVQNKDLPIGYYDTGKENNLPNQTSVHLGPVINGVRRPISKSIPQQPPPQVNEDELQDKIHHIEQPPEQLAPSQPVLKGAGPKIKMKDGSKVHLKELMKAKDMPTDTGNYQLPTSMSSELPITNENLSKHSDDIKLSYTVERNETTNIVDERAIHKTDDNVIKSHDERTHNRNDMASEMVAKSKDSLSSKRSNEMKLTDEDRTLKYAPVSILEDTQAVRAVSFHPEGGIYAIGANSKMLRICDMAMNGVNRENDGLPPMTVLFKRCKYHRGSIYCMDWSPDGRLLATGSNDKSIKILQFDAHQFTQTGEDIELNFHSGTVRELAFVPNKSGLLISGGTGDGSINITDTITQKIVGTLNGHTGNVMSVYAGVDLVATGGTDNAVRLWDLRSRRCIDVVIVGESCPASVTLSGSDKYLASGQEDGSILLYDLTAGRTLENFRLHQSDCRSVRFSIDSNYLLTSSYDCNVTLMHLTKKTEMASPKFYNVAKHSDKVIQCRWHPAENMFLSSSADKTSVLWKSIT